MQPVFNQLTILFNSCDNVVIRIPARLRLKCYQSRGAGDNSKKASKKKNTKAFKGNTYPWKKYEPCTKPLLRLVNTGKPYYKVRIENPEYVGTTASWKRNKTLQLHKVLPQPDGYGQISDRRHGHF